MNRVLVLFIFIIIGFQLNAQEPNDCINAVTVCGNSSFSSNATGSGNFQEVSGCGGFENNSLWLEVNVVQAGTLGFDLIPEDTDIMVDYDFWVFGPNRVCSNLGNPIRCATTNPNQAGLPNNHTGINGSTTLTQTGPGANGNSYVFWLNVNVGETYYIVIDRPVGEGGFELLWTGTAAEGTGAFPAPPDANAIEDITQCSSTTDIGIFDLNGVRPSINSDLVNNTIDFYASLADATDGVNPLPNIYANTSNPQQIYGRVSSGVTDCYTLVDFNLIVSPLPNAMLTASESSICEGESVTFTITGTPNATINYNINGGATQQIVLDASGITTIMESPTTDFSLTVENAQVLNSSGVLICSQGIGVTETVTVSNVTSPTILNNSPLCEGDDGELQFSGDPDAAISYAINGGAMQTFNLDATGNFTLIIPALASNIDVEVLSVTGAALPNCVVTLNTIETIVVNPSPMVTDPSPLLACDDGLNPNSASFDLNAESAAISNNDPNVTVTYYETQILAETGNPIDALVSPYDSTSSNQVIFVRAETDLGCVEFTTLNLQVVGAPIANVATDLLSCDTDNLGIGTFDLTQAEAEIIAGNTQAVEVSYYVLETEALAGSSSILSPTSFENTMAYSQTIYVRVDSDQTECFNIAPLNLEVFDTPIIASPEPLETCDDTVNDGVTQFNLDSQSAIILNGATGITVTYHISQLDAENNDDALISPYTNLNNNQTIFVRAENDLNTDCFATTSFNLLVNPLPFLVNPTPLSVCDDGVPDGLTELDLSLKDSEITDNNASYAVSYYLDLADANSGMNALPTLYTNTSNGQIIIARVEDTTTGCYATTTLELLVEQAPAAITPEPMRYCDPDNDGFGVFTLTDADDEITGGALGLIVTYHETEANANSNTLALDTTVDYNNISVNTQTLYARVESQTITTNCATIVELELIVEPSPQILEPTALVACDIFSADGFEAFDLTSSSAEVLNGQNPLQYIISYYESEADAASAIGAIANPLAYTNTVAGNQIIWIRVEDNTTIAGCYKLTPLELIVNPLPEAVAPTPLELCDDLGEIPGDELRLFDLTVKDSEITGSNGSWTTAYYETNADAQAQMNAIPDPTQYTNSSVNGLPANPQTLYVVVTDSDTGCVDFTTLTIRVLPNPTPTPSDQLPDLELCDTVNTGDGVEVFNLLGLGNDNAQADLILNGEQQVTLSYHETAEAADMGTDAIADPENFQNTESPDQRIYVRMSSNSTDCYAVVDFTIRVNPLPEVVAVTDFIQCELNTDGSASFDLRSKDEEVLNGQDPTEFIVTYHDNLADAESQANALASPYNNTSNPQEIFVTITNTITGCSISTQRFNVQVDEAAQANPDMDLILYQECDNNLETDGDPDNDSVQFDLSTQDAQVLDAQDPTNYIVTYYATEADANLNVNPLPNLYENISNPQVIYARVDNNTPDVITGNDTSICFEVAPLTLQVNPLPNFNLEDSYILCINTNGTEVLSTPILDTGLSVADYSFEWSYNGAVIPTATASALTPTQGGTYSVIVTDTSTSTDTGCMTMDTAEVIESAPPMLTAEVVTQLFGETNVIEAVATGLSDAYEYSLDGGPWQDSGLFTDVSPGLRLITARDKIGCGIATVEVLVIDYPLYFTPNGDGNNDTWNIAGIGSEAKIYIFDRYGKLIKQISPTGQGWNGTFNGSMMPTSDYWFTVLYNEPQTGNQKEFKAHFTLKR